MLYSLTISCHYYVVGVCVCDCDYYTKIVGSHGWIYDVCPKCNEKVDGEALPILCVGCGNESASTIPK